MRVLESLVRMGMLPWIDRVSAARYRVMIYIGAVYEAQPQQAGYGTTAQQYGAPEGGYNYNQQPDPSPSAAAGQYGTPAAYNPPQNYSAPTEGYNYGT